MRTHEVDLSSLRSVGNVTAEMLGETLAMTTTKALPTHFHREHLRIRSYVEAPELYRLPLRIDICAKIDVPGLFILFGEAHINFGTPWSVNRRINDIVEGGVKNIFFHNHIQMNELNEITFIYNLADMQILVNGEERFYSKKQKYIKSPLFAERNAEGFPLRIACTKRALLEVRSLTITEHDEDIPIERSVALPAPITRNLAVPEGEKPTFDNCICLLPAETQQQVREMDAFLRSLRPMRFARTLEKYGHRISYVASADGFSYTVYPSNDVLHHSFQWYVVTNTKQWHRKADHMNELLESLAKTCPELASRVFSCIKECVGCGPNCGVRAEYEHMGDKAVACHGSVELTMRAEDFQLARDFISALAYFDIKGNRC